MQGVKFIKTTPIESIEKHSFNDWQLIPKTKFHIDPAEPKTNYIDVFGSDSILDLTESLTGYVNYNMRDCEQTFTVVGNRPRWSSVYSEIQNFLQGQKLKVICDDEPDWYYTGRFQVSDWETFLKTAEITISGYVEPYKLSTMPNNDDWLWDDFNFEIGRIREHVYVLEPDGFQNLTGLHIRGSVKHVVPIFELDSSHTLGTGTVYLIRPEEGMSAKRELSEGENRYPDIIIGDGELTYYAQLEQDENSNYPYRPTLRVIYDVGSL